MAKKSGKWSNYLLWGGIAAVAYVVADNMGLIGQLKTKLGMQTRVSYYAQPTVNAPLGDGRRAYIGTAYGLGKQSTSGDYNSINMWE